MSDLWKERHEIDKARRERARELMKEYDETVYRPAKKALIERCAKLGHVPGAFHTNGFGWSWHYCTQCGGRTSISGPDDEKIPDDGVAK